LKAAEEKPEWSGGFDVRWLGLYDWFRRLSI